MTGSASVRNVGGECSRRGREIKRGRRSNSCSERRPHVSLLFTRPFETAAYTINLSAETAILYKIWKYPCELMPLSGWDNLKLLGGNILNDDFFSAVAFL